MQGHSAITDRAEEQHLPNWLPAVHTALLRVSMTACSTPEKRSNEKMKLGPEHEAMLAGEAGMALAKALATLVEYGKAFGADYDV